VKNSLYKFNLIHLISHEIQEIAPAALLKKRYFATEEAILCWGKAADSTWMAVHEPGVPHFLITPRTSEHPIPGPGSIRAGQDLLDFFESLGRMGVTRLTVFLSGGASSLAWIRPADISEKDLLRKLERLYRSNLDIGQLNRERSRLCALKGGGAARWLKKLAPRIHCRVEVISDVDPYDASVVGSGPFWGEGIPHGVLASNRTLVEALARRSPIPVLEAKSGLLAPPAEWVRRIRRHRHSSGLVILGGEPRIRVHGRHHGGSQGGRMTHLAALLALEFPGLEILCAATDGVDGSSGSSFTWIRPGNHLNPQRLRRALRTFDTASELRRVGALFPARPTGTNVQDVVLVRL
jgi:glycerate-2-kinase